MYSINDLYAGSKESKPSDKNLLIWAESYLKLHKEVEKDYTGKYKQYLVERDDK